MTNAAVQGDPQEEAATPPSAAEEPPQPAPDQAGALDEALIEGYLPL